MRKKTRGIFYMILGGTLFLVRLSLKEAGLLSNTLSELPPALADGLPVIIFIIGAIYFWIGRSEE